MDRRNFLSLASAGVGAVFSAGLPGCATPQRLSGGDFYFAQMSDSHWGYRGPDNPESATTLRKAVATINALADPPDFIMFTGDLTHTTDDPMERRRRLGEFRDIVGDLKVRNLRFMPGEHDAALDRGLAFQELFGPTHYAFEHKGVHFIVLDNVSDPGAKIGDEQLGWFQSQLAALDPQSTIVVFTHRPLFDLAPQWDWATRDGAKAIDLMMPYPNLTVFYGHIHQEHHHMTGHIAHHAARSLIFALPAPGSQEKRKPLPWDSADPAHGLGVREVMTRAAAADYRLTELAVLQS